MSLIRLRHQRPHPRALTAVGDMDQQVTILAPGTRNTDGSAGAPETFATSDASGTALAGRELEKAQQVVQEVTHLIAIPYQPGITQGMQVQLGTRIFQIEYIIDPDEQQTELRLYCMERGQNA